jgi:hypothetical protein
MTDLYCEVCGTEISGGKKAVQIFTGTTNSQGFSRNVLGKFLKPVTASEAVPHAECLNLGQEEGERIETQCLGRDILFDVAGLELKEVYSDE